jgi:alpha-galactosidase
MYAREFWTGQTHLLLESDDDEKYLVFPQVPAHGVIVLAIRSRYSYRPQYLGSSLHISQGLEVAHWQPHEKTLELELVRPGHSQGQVELAIPGQIQAATLNQSPIAWQSKFGDIYSFDLDFHQSAHIEINYS